MTMCDILGMYLIAGVLTGTIFILLRGFLREKTIKILQIMSKMALIFLCVYPFKLVMIGQNEKLDAVIIPITLIIILFWRFYASYLFFTTEKNLQKRNYLVLGGLYCCLFLLGLPIYRYFDNATKNIISITMLIGGITFLVVYYYRKWKK